MVRGVNWVGDAVMTIPALREIRRILPKSRISLAAQSSILGIFTDADFVDEILPIDSHGSRLSDIRRQVGQWREGRFDLTILLQNAFQAAMVARLARISRRMGYATDGRRFLLTSPLEVPKWRKERHEVYYYLNIAAELETSLTGQTIVFDHPPDISLAVSDDRLAEARKRLIEAGAFSARPNKLSEKGPSNILGNNVMTSTFKSIAIFKTEKEIVSQLLTCAYQGTKNSSAETLQAAKELAER